MLRKLVTFLGLTFCVSALAKKDHLYQVMASHPHDIEAMKPYISTVKQEGRLWLAHISPSMPKKLLKYFRQTDGRDVRTYLPDMTSAKLKMASPSILSQVNKVNIDQIKTDVEWLSSFRSRSAGSEDNKKTEQWFFEEFSKLGFSVSRECYRPDACSIIADKLGELKPKEIILILAHFDSVGKTFAGADDNASGAAVLLEVARLIKNTHTQKTIRFLATNGEELGLLGAEHYSRLLVTRGEVKDIKLAINMDMVGYNSNGVVELETNAEYEDLANWYASLAAQYTALTPKITLGAWGSDHVPFLKKGVPTLLTIEDWSTKTPCYHMECDKPETLNFDYAGEVVKLNTAAILTKDKQGHENL